MCSSAAVASQDVVFPQHNELLAIRGFHTVTSILEVKDLCQQQQQAAVATAAAASMKPGVVEAVGINGDIDL